MTDSQISPPHFHHRADSPLLQLPNTYRAFYGGFLHLHSIQREAVEPILAGRDLVLQSATGSGKTEAVLAPCTERVIRSGRANAVLYIVPTRALAVDLERRLTPVLTGRLGLQLGIRTGDLKRAGGARPDVLLTTPESLDVLLGSSNAELQRFVRRVRMVVIDEVHPLLHQYRGKQLAWLLRRLKRRAGGAVQNIALSATIADVGAVIDFFGFRPDAVRLMSAVQRDIAPHLVHLKRVDEELPGLLDDLHDKWGYRKVLMFANSRGQCDRLFSIVSGRGRFQGVAELHYSNLKPRERRAIEDRFRRRHHALCIATSTLELGIDIGDVDGVLLFDPPDSVSAFLQRIGRSNRREGVTRFWGVCRGERAGEQLLRFLGLLRLAGRGVVEAPLSNPFPSVLVQQTLSCIYEKKYISLPAMRGIFPEAGEALEIIFPSMERQGWLRRGRFAVSKESQAPGMAAPHAHDPKNGFFHGGWRYRDSLLDRRIWSNFPETEVDYVLEVSGEAVADLPHSTVRQLEPGDCVHIAARRIRILQIIDTGERKRVLAEPTERLDDKELLWLGPGFQVPFEVAQSMRVVAGAGGYAGTVEAEEMESEALHGLFARTRRLLDAERKRSGRAVMLANGIEVLRDSGGFYRYRTFIGSMGNLILRFTIERSLGAPGDLYVTSDELGITCSHWIDFKTLPLPRDRDGFRRWTTAHLRTLKAMLPLNAFAQALPESLLVEEVTGFLYDLRLAEVFSTYLSEPSRIVSGDPAALELPLSPDSGGSPREVFLQPAACSPLLAWEKERRGIVGGEGDLPFVLPSHARHVPRALTGTIVGGYIRHHQCERWLSFQFLPPGMQPRARDGAGSELDGERTARGRQHEENVLASLRESSIPLAVIRETDEGGRRLSLKSRFSETLERLKSAIVDIECGDRESLYISQAVLVVPSLLGEYFLHELSGLADGAPISPAGADGPGGSLADLVDGVGVPDLIRVCRSEGTVHLEVGDIKDSAVPHYSQKWQVAFYALLLEECIRRGLLPSGVRVSGTGFMILRRGPSSRPAPGDREPDTVASHYFDLAPHMAAFPALLHSMAEVLLRPPEDATCFLQDHCTTCPSFETCYMQALREEEIQLLPHLSRGEHLKLSRLGLSTMEDAAKWLREGQSDRDPFTPHQRERLAARLEAVQGNRIALRNPRSRLFPSNLSTAIFVHLEHDPVSGFPRVLAYRALDESGSVVDTASWVVVEEHEVVPLWRMFSDRFLALWERSIVEGKGPHLFHFGEKTRRVLSQWGEYAEGPSRFSSLLDPSGPYCTDLGRLLRSHFDLPAPGRLTLFATSRILGLLPTLGESGATDGPVAPPESLFHDDPEPYIPSEVWRGGEHERLRADAARRVELLLGLQAEIWKWVRTHVGSDFEQIEWRSSRETGGVPAEPYLHFLEEQRRLREEDILALQELSLEERVERFRALGPLTFLGTSLDEEGRFLYDFRTSPENAQSKFREDDFLKLAPVGSRDLQSGFPVILARYSPGEERLSVLSRRGRPPLNRRLAYSLEEDITDWTHPSLVHVVRGVLTGEQARDSHIPKLLSGRWAMSFEGAGERLSWIRSLQRTLDPLLALNASQRAALELPFRHKVSLIEGPPGTGKTHLLGWIVIALMLHAREHGEPLRIAVSALTHRAIDGVLRKVAGLVNQHRIKDFPARVAKLGRWKDEGANGNERFDRGHHAGESSDASDLNVQSLRDPEEIRRSRHLVLGSTGFGLYNLLGGRTGAFPQVFDWVVFDEASQLLVPQALLSLVHGKGGFLFLGDVHQLPPVVLGNHAGPEQEGASPASALNPPPNSPYSHGPAGSILSRLLERYGAEHRVMLDLSYRMNEELCAFPSRMWYGGLLRPAPGNARSRLHLGSTCSNPAPAEDLPASTTPRHPSGDLLDKILEPEKPVVLVLADRHGRDHHGWDHPGREPHRRDYLGRNHLGYTQQSDLEAEIAAQLTCRLMVRHGLTSDSLAIVSPHRAHNNAVAARLSELPGMKTLALPVIDTVERVQGAERDVILFALTVSDPDRVMSKFINNPNRFNVALTRARKKLIVIGSPAFFLAVPQDEESLRRNLCFKKFLELCRQRDSLFVWNEG